MLDNRTGVLEDISLKKLRKIITDRKDKTTTALLDFKTFEYVRISVKNRPPHILQLDVPYKPTPSAATAKAWEDELVREIFNFGIKDEQANEDGKALK